MKLKSKTRVKQPDRENGKKSSVRISYGNRLHAGRGALCVVGSKRLDVPGLRDSRPVRTTQAWLPTFRMRLRKTPEATSASEHALAKRSAPMTFAVFLNDGFSLYEAPVRLAEAMTKGM